MNMRALRRLSVLFLILGAGCLVPSASAEELRNDAGHWRMQIPAKWARMGIDKMAQFRAPANEPNVVSHGGFELAEFRRGADQAPFFVIEEDRGARNPFETYDQIESELNRDFRRLLEAQPGVRVGKVKLDRKKNRIEAELEMNQPGAKVQGIVYAFLGKNSILTVACFAHERDYPQQKETFDAMADSFRYDDGHEFVPFSMGKGLAIGGGVCGGLLCILVVVVAVIVVFFRMTARRA
jgi:hypothetical protein